MKERVRSDFAESISFLKTFFKWLLCAAVVGSICGLVGTAFHFAVDWATQTRQAQPWLLYLLPVAGLVIVASYHLCGMDRDRGTNLVILSIRTDQRAPIVMAPLIFLGTVLTHLCGGSTGREGAALQIGGSIGTFLGRVFRLNQKDLHVMTMCGMAALFSALFGTPVTATIFSLEVISVGVLYYAAFLPCALAALIAARIAGAFGIAPTAFALACIPSVGWSSVLQVVAVALVCALCSMGFILCMHGAGRLYERLLKNPYLRIVVGAALVIVLTLLCGSRDYNGAGMDVVVRAIGGQARPWDFLLKIIFTALTLGAGFKGGEIVPTFFIGATLGCTLGGLIGLDPGFAAAIGLVAMFCGVVNCPLASILLSIELFGAQGLALFAIACAVSYMMSGYYSLYSGQKILYSKLSAEYINLNAR